MRHTHTHIRQLRVFDRLLTVAVVVAAVGLLLLFAGAGAHALQAAGLSSKTGAIGGVDTFVANLTDNVKWLVATGIGLSIAIVGLLFMTGHSRAHDIAIKAGLGAAIIVGLGGISK
jgi:hypothetical protein